MKYKIGTRIDFIDADVGAFDYHEQFKVIAYAITKDNRVVYLIWCSYNEYGNQYEFMTEDALAKEIKDKEDCGYIVKIRGEE